MMNLPRNSAIKVLVGLLGAGVIFSGFYYLFIDPYTSRLIQARVGDSMAGSKSSEVKDAWFLLSPSNGGGIYHEGDLKYDDYAKDGSIVTDIAVADDRETVAKIKYTPGGESSSVGVNGTDVLTSNTIKTALAISPKGSYIAFASIGELSKITQHDGWRVNVVDAVTGELKEYEGFAAVFLTDDQVLLFKQDGVYLLESATGALTQVIKNTFLFPHAVRVALSEGRDRLAWSDGFKDSTLTKVYDVRPMPQLFAMQVGELDAVRGPIAVTENYVYALAPEGSSTKLRQHAFDGSEMATLRSFPSILNVTKIIP